MDQFQLGQLMISRLLKFGIVAVFFLLLYYNVWVKLIFDWMEDPNYSHGFIVPIISLFLIWKRWPDLKKIENQTNHKGLIVLCFGLILFFLGNMGNELFLKRLSMIVVLSGLIFWNLGWAYLKAISFPLIFLFFMIPLPYILYDSIAFPLQLTVSKLSVNLLQIFQIPAFREGNIIYLASTTLQVEEACSGIRSLVSLLALTSIYAYMFHEGTIKRITLIASAIPIAILVNLIRVTSTGILATFYGEKATQGLFHETLGWGVFIIAFVLVVLVSKIISYGYNVSRRSKK